MFRYVSFTCRFNTDINCTSTSMTDWIKLNVGGTMFETTRSTLVSDRESILARMFDSDSNRPPAENQDGVFLIDACPRAFAVILNWLRYKDVILSKDIQAEEVIPVADFFGLDSLRDKLDDIKRSKTDMKMEMEKISVSFDNLNRNIQEMRILMENNKSERIITDGISLMEEALRNRDRRKAKYYGSLEEIINDIKNKMRG